MNPCRCLHVSEKHTAIDDAHICPKTLTGEVGHVSHVIAEVPDSKEPMEDGSPNSHPGHELWIERHVMSFNDIKDGVIEQRDQTGDSHDGQRLGTKDAEDDASQGGGEERFVDTVETAGP